MLLHKNTLYKNSLKYIQRFPSIKLSKCVEKKQVRDMYDFYYTLSTGIRKRSKSGKEFSTYIKGRQLRR